MRHFLFFALFFSISTFNHAQDAVIAVDKMNVFYLGLDNPISIAMPNTPSSELSVSIDNGNIKQVEEGQYIVNVTRPGQAIITVQSKNHKTEKKFRVKVLPNPKTEVAGIIFNGRSTESVDLNRFKATTGISAPILNFDIDGRCIVMGYIAIISTRGGEVKQFKMMEAKFSPELLLHIQTMQIGDTAAFLNVKSRCPGDEISRDLDGLTLIMK